MMTPAPPFATIPPMPFTVRPVREERKLSGRTRKYLLFAAAIAESVFRLYRWKKVQGEEEALKVRRTRTLKRTVSVLLAILVVLLLAVGTLKILVRLKALSLSGVTSMVGTALLADENGFTNILLLGVGDGDHDGVDLTDTIMVASLDPKRTRSIVLLSLPRDLAVLSTEKMGKGRINSLYRDYKITLVHGGMKNNEASIESLRQLGKEIGTLLDLPIHGVIKINFSGFEQAIDALGGIDVVVPEDIVDPEYPGPNYTYQTFMLSKGPHHLSGSTALQYVRSRHSTSDFSRSARQQQVLAAAAAKTKATGLLKSVGKSTEILSIISRNMETTFSTREFLGLVDLGKKIDQKRIISMQLSDENGLFGSGIGRGGFLYAPPREEFEGASVLLPVSIPEFPVTWKQIQAFSALLFGQRELFLKPPGIVVLNAGAKEGAARKLGGELYRYGFNVINTRNFARRNNPSFSDSFLVVNPSLLSPKEDDRQAVDRLENAQTSATTLRKLLQLKKAPSSVDPPAAFEGNADIAIVLGKDFSLTPLQDLLR